MSKAIGWAVAIVIGFVAGMMIGGGAAPAEPAPAAPAASGFAAVPGEVGGQDLFGPYDVVEDWPKGVETLPGHEKWTSGAAQGIFAENPNRVYLLARGELPHFRGSTEREAHQRRSEPAVPDWRCAMAQRHADGAARQWRHRR